MDHMCQSSSCTPEASESKEVVQYPPSEDRLSLRSEFPVPGLVVGAHLGMDAVLEVQIRSLAG